MRSPYGINRARRKRLKMLARRTMAADAAKLVWDRALAVLDSGEYYDRQGLPITFLQWGDRFHNLNYRRVVWTDLGPVQVSTVWLGIDHGWGLGPPVIFETFIFCENDQALTGADGEELIDTWGRYRTIEEAIAGHEEAVRQVREAILPPEAEALIRQLIESAGFTEG
jgi:hypothetical protein